MDRSPCNRDDTMSAVNLRVRIERLEDIVRGREDLEPLRRCFLLALDLLDDNMPDPGQLGFDPGEIERAREWIDESRFEWGSP